MPYAPVTKSISEARVVDRCEPQDTYPIHSAAAVICVRLQACACLSSTPVFRGTGTTNDFWISAFDLQDIVLRSVHFNEIKKKKKGGSRPQIAASSENLTPPKRKRDALHPHSPPL